MDRVPDVRKRFFFARTLRPASWQRKTTDGLTLIGGNQNNIKALSGHACIVHGFKADEDIGLTHREHAIPGELYDENRSPFIDWNRSELYELQRGEGECAI